MASFINYRFKSNKDFSQVFFESNGLPLWELKYEIIAQRKMVSKDFDLLFYDAETEEQITDEYAHIPRNSHIIVHRIPAWMSKNSIPIRERKTDQIPSKKFLKEPPENYICFRCGNKGHFIQHCPTNNNRDFDIVKFRRPSGIPRDYLEKVNGGMEGSNAMLVTDDGFVKALPQTQEWAKHGTILKGLGNIPQDLKCSRCCGLMSRPVVTSCGHRYCEGCIQVDARCAVCSKIVTRANYDRKTASKIDVFLGKPT